MDFNIKNIFSENTANTVLKYANAGKITFVQNNVTLFTTQLAMIRNKLKDYTNSLEQVVNAQVYTKEEYSKLAIFFDRLDSKGALSFIENAINYPKLNNTAPLRQINLNSSYKEIQQKYSFKTQQSTSILKNILLFIIFSPISSIFINVKTNDFLANLQEKMGGIGMLITLIVLIVGIAAPFILVKLYNDCFGLYKYKRNKIINDVYDEEIKRHTAEVENCKQLLSKYSLQLKELENYLNQIALQEKTAIPYAYWNDAETIYNYIINRRADTLKEVLNLVEISKHHQRMEESQERAELNSAAAYSAATAAERAAKDALTAAEEAASEARSANRY